MIHVITYRGQDKPLICFDERQARRAIERLRAMGRDFTLQPFSASFRAVARIKWPIGFRGSFAAVK